MAIQQTGLFEEFRLRDVVIPNRVGLAPMSLYSAQGGRVQQWHHIHYGARSFGVGLVVVEATSVSPEGRATPADLGLWEDGQVDGVAGLVETIVAGGAVPGIQLSHAGRKASRSVPWEGDLPIEPADGGWASVGPSATAFADGYRRPRALMAEECGLIAKQFADAAKRAVAAGFRFVEIHAAHGRLLHSFYSPQSNHRTDGYGGSFEGRTRLLGEVVRAVRGAIGEGIPLCVRLSCVDWLDDGWLLQDSVRLAAALRVDGADMIDCSSGGITRPLRVPLSAGYQVEFAEGIRRDAGIPTAAVGLIRDMGQAERILMGGRADMVFLGRALVADPLLVLRDLLRDRPSAMELVPPQYRRALGLGREQGVIDHLPEL